MTKVSDRYLDERRAEILEGAKRVFVRKGYGSATIQDIASEAQVAAGSIYRYYPSKADLIAAVAEQSAFDDRVLFATADPAEDESDSTGAEPDRPASPMAALLASGEQLRRSLHETDGLDLCVLRMESGLAAYRDDEVRERVRVHIRHTRATLEELIVQAQRAGELDTSVDAKAIAGLLHAFVAGSSTLRISLGEEANVDPPWALMTRLFGNLVTPGFAERFEALTTGGLQPSGLRPSGHSPSTAPSTTPASDVVSDSTSDPAETRNPAQN